MANNIVRSKFRLRDSEHPPPPPSQPFMSCSSHPYWCSISLSVSHIAPSLSPRYRNLSIACAHAQPHSLSNTHAQTHIHTHAGGGGGGAQGGAADSVRRQGGLH